MVLPSLDVLWAFALVSAVMTIIPGVDTALVLRTATRAGLPSAWGTVVGIQFGVLTWGAATAVGVSALLAASQVAYNLLRFAGAFYLMYLGGRLLWRAFRRGLPDGPPQAVQQSGSFWTGLRRGVFTNLLNPKVGAFYVALLPQFIPAAAPHLIWGIALACVHVVLGVLWLGGLSFLAHAARNWFRRSAVRRATDAVSGAVIAGFGLDLALAQK